MARPEEESWKGPRKEEKKIGEDGKDKKKQKSEDDGGKFAESWKLCTLSRQSLTFTFLQICALQQ